jgi:Glyoxalase/Bleomycin resistance protein/Dioxygenase superfamily
MDTMLSRATISQIGLVVKDIEQAMQGFWKTAGIGPWSIYTNSAPPLRCIYRGQPAEYKVRLALARSGDVQMELIEYIEGDSIHRDFLAAGRQGLEHVGIFVTDLELAMKPYRDIGIGVLQRVDGLGVKGDGRYAYLDTEEILGTIVELIQNSSQPVPPERTYPFLH